MRRVMELLLIFTLLITPQAFAKISVPPFPITDSVPRVWEWEVVKEEVDLRQLFVWRYHLAPDGDNPLGPIGLTLTLKNIPDFGILYQAWGIKTDGDGEYDFSSAVFAFKLENQWYEVRAGFSPRVAFEVPPDSVTVYENEKVVVYRRVVDEKFGGRERFVLRAVRQLWSGERRETLVVVKSIYLIIERPQSESHDSREDWVHEFKLPQPKVVEIIEKLN